MRRRGRQVFTVLGAFALAVASPSAHASGGAATDAYDGIGDAAVDVHGLVDLYAQHAFGAPAQSSLALRAFDTSAGELRVGAARVTLAHRPGVFGARVDLAAGDLADGYLRYDPAAADHPGFSRAISYFEQAFVSAKVPVGTGLVIGVGRFGTPVGLEDNESLQNWNYSRSLLYLLAEPSFHAGARATYAFTEQLAVSALWVNGWDAAIFDGNGMRSLGLALTWKPASRLELVLDYMGGPERAPTRPLDPKLGDRSILDASARYEVTKRLSVACTGDLGRDAAGRGATWWGLAGYARFDALDWLAGSVRAERYADPDGFTTGAKQVVAEVTATAELHKKLGPVQWTARLEYRRDQSSTAFFSAGSTHQDTLGASMLAAF